MVLLRNRHVIILLRIYFQYQLLLLNESLLAHKVGFFEGGWKNSPQRGLVSIFVLFLAGS
jgi:hypothetical protein